MSVLFVDTKTLVLPPPPPAGVAEVIGAPLCAMYKTAAFQVRLSLPILKDI